MSRFAAIDIGTNSVLLLVAQRQPSGAFTSVLERADITRLGQGVDQHRALAPEAMERTLATLERFVSEAKTAGASAVVVSATSAARDASNGADFIAAAKARAGVELQIIPGDEEARLSFASAFSDFGGHGPLVVLDIGGGSTEVIMGNAAGAIEYRHSFDVGAVRLTERHLRSDPPAADELETIRALLRQTFSAVPTPPRGARLVAVAGTATTLAAVAHRISPYDGNAVHGSSLTRQELDETLGRLAALPVHLRRSVPGLEPKRADVIVAGALVLQAAMEALGVREVTISDRGLRWGLLVDRFGARS